MRGSKIAIIGIITTIFLISNELPRWLFWFPIEFPRFLFWISLLLTIINIYSWGIMHNFLNKQDIMPKWAVYTNLISSIFVIIMLVITIILGISSY